MTQLTMHEVRDSLVAFFEAEGRTPTKHYLDLMFGPRLGGLLLDILNFDKCVLQPGGDIHWCVTHENEWPEDRAACDQVLGSSHRDDGQCHEECWERAVAEWEEGQMPDRPDLDMRPLTPEEEGNAAIPGFVFRLATQDELEAAGADSRDGYGPYYVYELVDGDHTGGIHGMYN